MSRILTVAVHPDDETLGCGGTLLKHKANGDKIHWLIATSIKEEDGFVEKDILQREDEVKKVSHMYDFDAVHQLEFSTKKIDGLPHKKMIDKISTVFNSIKPDIVYLPFNNDVHSDHRIIFDAAYSCTKIFRYPFIKKILMMETISETEFTPNIKDFIFAPNYFVDISDFLDKKLEITKVFKSELGQHPFPRSLEGIKALATFRGVMAGCKYAESFMLLKEIV